MPKVSAKQTNLPHKCAACGGSQQLQPYGAGPLLVQTGVKSKREKERGRGRQRAKRSKGKTRQLNQKQTKQTEVKAK